MNIENVKYQLIKQRTFKAKCLKQAEQYNQASVTVELKKDIDALDYVHPGIRILHRTRTCMWCSLEPCRWDR